MLVLPCSIRSKLGSRLSVLWLELVELVLDVSFHEVFKSWESCGSR